MRQQGDRDPTDPRVRVEAAVAIIDTLAPHKQEAAQIAAFMEIFHPGHPATDALIRDAKDKGRR